MVQTDASEHGLGAVLLQRETGQLKPIAYISRKLLPRESNYSTVEKECLAIKWPFDSLRYYLLGRKFILETDYGGVVVVGAYERHKRQDNQVVPCDPAI